MALLRAVGRMVITSDLGRLEQLFIIIAVAVGTGLACRLVFEKRWIGSNNMKDGGKYVENHEHVMLIEGRWHAETD